MTDYEMRKQTIEAYVNSEWYVKHSEKERSAMLLVLGSDTGLTDQTKKNANSDYYVLTQLEISAKKKEKVECLVCHKILNRNSLSRHKKTCGKKIRKPDKQIGILKIYFGESV